jgi:hypothetical protein
MNILHLGVVFLLSTAVPDETACSPSVTGTKHNYPDRDAAALFFIP